MKSVCKGDIILSSEEFYLGYQIREDTIFLFKSPILSIKLFQSIIELKSITIIECNLFKKKDIDDIITFLNSLDEKEYKYKLTYIKFGIILVKVKKIIENNILI